MAPQPPPLPNSYWVVPERLLAGEHPSGRTEETTFERLRRLLDAGIDCFIDLTEPGELGAYDKLLPGARAAGAVVHLRKPIRDHGLPESTEQMEEILDELDSALAEGRRIYLHCRAGIGRTNLVAGCWLASGGLTGEEALQRLNELWRENARSQTWPSVPETEAQCDYVRDWRSQRPRAAIRPPAARMVTSMPMATPASGDPRDRCRGLLLGLAMGDALGQSTGGQLGLPAGAWAGKTAMAMCLAESLVACGGFDAADQVRRYQAWQREGHWSSTGTCVGASTETLRALARAHWSGNPYAGSHDPANVEPEPLARIGPAVAFFRADPREAIGMAVNCARITHQAPLTLDAVRYFAGLLAGALAGAGKDELMAPDFSPVPGIWDAAPMKPRIQQVAAGSWRGRQPRALIPGANAAPRALAAALWAFEQGSNPQECLVAAANLGAEADTTAAMVGQLAGAHYGAAALPPEWRATLARGAEIEAMALALLEPRRVPE